jgi:hypothetical protein
VGTICRPRLKVATTTVKNGTSGIDSPEIFDTAFEAKFVRIGRVVWPRRHV